MSLGHDSNIPRAQRVALAACLFLITGVFGFLQPFVPLYLQAAGLSKEQFGFVTALGTGLGLVIQPLLGRLSDRLDARRPVMIAAAVAAGCAYLSYRLAGSLWAFILLTALGVNGFQYLNAVGGVLVGRMVAGRRARGGAAYAGYRVWGSVGYIVIGLGTGLLVNRSLSGGAVALTRAQLDPIFTLAPLLFFAVALVALFVPDGKALLHSPELPPGPAALPPSPPTLGGVGPAGQDFSAVHATEPRPTHSSPPRLGGSGGRLGGPGKTKDEINLDRFFAAYFLYQFALYGASQFLPLFMRELGATPLLISAMFAAGVVSEVLVMSRVGRWTDRHGRRPALVAAFVLMPLRLLLYIPATDPRWVLAVQTLHGLNFGIVGTIAVVFVNDHAGEAERGAVHARLAGVSGLALALGPLVCGAIAERAGIGWMFAAMSAVGALAALLLVTRVRESHPNPVPLGGFRSPG